MLIVAAFYGPPGGDLLFWQQLAQEFQQLRARYPDARFILLGDANIHLSYLVTHEETCVCLHCRACPTDQKIEQLLNAIGLRAFNPPIPTHVSGTIIDLVFGDKRDSLEVNVSDENFACSDHAFVRNPVKHKVEVAFASNLGRVTWASHADWDEGLGRIEVSLDTLATAVQNLLHCDSLRPRAHGDSAGQRQRRGLLDMAAWARDVLYVVVGHCCSAVSCKPAAAKTRQSGVMGPSSTYRAYSDFKIAAEKAVWKQQCRTVDHYRQLWRRNRGVAEKFMSRVVKAADRFTIMLTDESTGEALSGPETLDAIVNDLLSRAQNDFPQDPAQASMMRDAVLAIARSGAVPADAHDAEANATLYTVEELDETLGKFNKGRRCIGGCYAALCAQLRGAVGSHLLLLTSAGLWPSRRLYGP